jgi:selenocysteine lyase/cysteine desulfurase
VRHRRVGGRRTALELILEVGVDSIAERVLALARQVREGARGRGVELACDAEGDEASGITSFRLEDATVYATALEQRGVIVSAREGCLRVATHHFNNEADLERLLEAFQ